VIHNGHLFTDAGEMTCANAAAGVPAGAVVLGGWAHAAGGNPYVEDLGIGAVPATAVWVSGMCFHADGRLYVTTEAAVSFDVYARALRFRQDGALRVSTAGVGATDAVNSGWAQAQSGEARMSIT
jgi:hypothetical protein